MFRVVFDVRHCAIENIIRLIRAFPYVQSVSSLSAFSWNLIGYWSDVIHHTSEQSRACASLESYTHAEASSMPLKRAFTSFATSIQTWSIGKTRITHWRCCFENCCEVGMHGSKVAPPRYNCSFVFCSNSSI